MTTIYYSKDYIGAKTDFDTTRKSGWINQSLVEAPIKGVVVRAPKPLTVKEVEVVHSPGYVRALRTGERNGTGGAAFSWDEGYWRAIIASSGGVVEAAIEAFRTKKNTGSLSSGIHHAGRDYSMGFCSINSLAIAAIAAHRVGAKNVLIVDTDAHMGGGTHSLVKDLPYVYGVDVSVSSLDSYKPDNVQFTLDLVQDARQYMPTLNLRLRELDDLGIEFDLILANQGMDPYMDCTCGGLDGIDFAMMTDREQTLFGWAKRRRTPVAFCLAGGYTGGRLTEESLVDLHRLTIAAAVA